MKHFFLKKTSNQMLLTLCLTIAILCGQSAALSILSADEINENVTLTLANSPYVSNENLIVGKKGKLTIEPGCELRFAKGKQLIVYGTLVARGTLSKRIKLTKAGGSQAKSVETPKTFRLVEGETIQDGKLQIFYNSKWNYVCSTQFNWTITDGNITCKSLGNCCFYGILLLN